MRRAIILSFAIVLETFSCLMSTGRNMAASEFTRLDERQGMIDMARLSDAVYDAGTKKHKIPPGFELYKESTDGKDGFQAAAYKNKMTGQIVIAYRGTEFSSLDDLKTDYQLGRDSENSPQYNSQIKQALDFYDRVKKNSGSSNIAVTGHSLGGNLAQMVGAKNEVPTQTFNAPGVSEETLKKNDITINKSLPIVNHIRDSDPVGNFGEHIGQVRKYPDYGDPDGIGTIEDIPGGVVDNHRIAPFIKDAESRKDLENGAYKDFTSLGVDATDAKLNERRAREATASGNESSSGDMESDFQDALNGVYGEQGSAGESGDTRRADMDKAKGRQDDKYYHEGKGNYKGSNEDRVGSKTKKDADSEWARNLGSSVANSLNAAANKMAAQKQAQDAARLARIETENRRIEAENRRRAEEARARSVENERRRQEMTARKNAAAKQIRECEAQISKLEREYRGLLSMGKKVLVELAAGLYCSECNRSKSEIEGSGESFSAHLKRVKGRAEKASPSLVKRKTDEYNQKLQSTNNQIEQVRQQMSRISESANQPLKY